MRRCSLIPDSELNEENIIPPALDKRVANTVAKAVIDLGSEIRAFHIHDSFPDREFFERADRWFDEAEMLLLSADSQYYCYADGYFP